MTEAKAYVTLPKIFTANMVLQRDTEIKIWGWAEKSETVTVSFNGQLVKSKADKAGTWIIILKPMTYGGPYQLKISGKKNVINLENILIGDVWICGGQSNMVFPLKKQEKENFGGVDNADVEIAGANFPQIRLFQVKHKFALHPEPDLSGEGWAIVTPESVDSFSAVAYLFGRELHLRYHVPVGLIESDWGGTIAEAWISKESLKAFPEFQKTFDLLQRLEEQNGLAEHDRYVKQNAEWHKLHDAEDRGMIGDRNLWAEPGFNTEVWPTTIVPANSVDTALKGFDGAVWYRKEIEVPPALAAENLILHLGRMYWADTTYFNGVYVGQTSGFDKSRDYYVDGKHVKGGRNVITIHLRGRNSAVCIYGLSPETVYAGIGGQILPLGGNWSFQAGADLDSIPVPPIWEKFIYDPKPTVLFNGMIAPLVSFKIRGFIWYQGEANASENRAEQYRRLFPALIADWRKHWGYDVPFLFVQLAGFGPNKADPAEYQWAVLREAQSQVLSLPNTGMATAIDLGDEKDIHPTNKQEVAHRLALAAIKVAYGENIVHSGPAYQSMLVEGEKIRISFSNLGSGLLIRDKYGYARGFEIASDDGKFVWAQAVQDGNDIIVFNEAIRLPVAVRYDWSNTPGGNIFNKEGLPAPPFRTDDWSVVEK